jgi:hypothetical protein
METVECHSSSAYDERPIALTWEGQRLDIIEILADWRTPDEHRFRVRTGDLRVFELAYRTADAEYPEISSGHEWQIQPITGV